ncbi:NAD/ferredoxin-dependent reductase-like protein [Actinocorallia herbida]|uniref:NAD/ferredoxin-dependent reductase-like protein n=1 Tax=Actinocorallia herbida TaxID=58109 RepID=A0A3N1D183_9ACTN|nr:FAD-dependent oxidoreductase [Actinocorallia herbida]ROO87276.1 NAD/ferredoxin-dependent reductase-like protein [Actinocorallia herbida]
MSDRKPLVVVGASLAGLRAVESARASGYDGPITLIGAEPHLPYDRPPLSKAFLEGKTDVPMFREEATYAAELGVEVMLGAPADRLDPDEDIVWVGGEPVEFSALVVATGASARIPEAWAAIPGVTCLRGLDDALAVKSALESGARVVVIGAGFIGSEVASAARHHGCAVTVLEAQPAPLARAVGTDLGHALAAVHVNNGTDLRLGTAVRAIHGTGRVESVELDDGTLLPADLVVVGIGASPATAWLRGSGVALHEVDGGILCDEHLATSRPGVYAAGDAVHWPNALLDQELVRLENWTNAAAQGGAAGRNAVQAGDPQRYETVPYVWSDWYDTRIQLIGHPAEDEVKIVSGEVGGERLIVLYRSGDRLAGAFTLNEPGKIMKYRRLIHRRGTWDEALALFPA